uniref:Reverse transcriptase domain-containing protein n=1 Tax=Storeatula sp. CCMP1868 TaxID=195070 RepID=A0A2P1G866_9CRYP|nr:hypothetical protein StoMt_p004 [Storeatula sp. CCMP1868]AVM81133.1 hypothetical protein StoMt_p004 [Storeatula sp. CCMP1868]
MKKLTSLAIVGKYNYSLLDRTLSVTVNSLGNKFYVLVEITRTYKTFSYCFIPPIYFQSFLGDRMICVMLHLVNYSYIALSLGVKVRRKIMKFAGNGATSLFGKPNNKVYSNTVIMHYAGVILFNKIKLDRDMSVGFINPRAAATFNKGVAVGVIRKEYGRVLQRFYSSKGVKRDLAFSQEWELLESNLIKDIKKGNWPRLTAKANIVLKQLQAEICRLSLIGSNEMAMKLIEAYSMNIVIRYIAINRITVQSGSTPGIDNFIVKNNSHKIDLLFQSKETKLSSLSTMKVKLVEIPKPDGSVRSLGISTMLDRVLQTQLYLLLDPFYEAKYPEHMYGFRKGRNTHQAVGFLKAVLERSDVEYAGLILLDIEKCFDNISHQAIFTHFIVPNKWKPLLFRWLKSKTVDKNNQTSSTVDRGIVQGSVIGPMICNVILTKALFQTVSSSTKLALFKDFKATSSIQNVTTGKKSQRNIYRNIIVYADDIVITTTNRDETGDILTAISNSLLKFGLNVSQKKSQVIDYSDGKPIKFEYLGFSFVYVSSKRIKKGGILTRYDDITNRKFSKTLNGTYLVYPNSEKFRDIKSKCKSLIKLLLKASLLEVLNKINPVIRGFAIYYTWSNGYNRLRTLDGLLVRYFKKYLIRKFRNRGVRRPVWVAKNFLVCKTSLEDSSGRFTSPYNLKWHPHTRLVKSKDNRKRFKKVLFLIMPSKVSKMLPITSAILPQNLRTQPYYLVDDKFAANSAKLYSKRINTDNYKEKLFIRQKGICPHCKIALANSDKNDFSLDVFGNDLEVHHNNGLAEMQKISKSAHKTANSFNNLTLLHKSCHLEITLKIGLRRA